MTIAAASKPWNPASAVKPVRDILIAMEIAPPIDQATRRRLERIFYFREYFGRDGAGHVVMVLRCILESSGNEGALCEPVVDAVSAALRPAFEARGLQLIEAFDTIPLLSILETMRGLEIFSEKSIGEYLAIAIGNRLGKIFSADIAPAQVKAKPVRKAPARITRVPVIEKRIAMGLQLLELKAKSRRNNDYSTLRKRHFPDLEPKAAMQATAVARLYGSRPEIFRRAGWRALVQLASRSLSPAVRLRFETRILAGADVKGITIKRARGRLPNGRPGRRQQSSEAMAA